MLVKNVGCSGDCGKLINCARYLAPFLSSLTLRPCSFSPFIYSHLPFNFGFMPCTQFLRSSYSYAVLPRIPFPILWAKVAQLICMAKKKTPF